MIIDTNTLNAVKINSNDCTEVWYNGVRIFPKETTTGGTITITREGGIKETYTYNDGIVPARAFLAQKDITNVEINIGIIEIGDYAFCECSKLYDAVCYGTPDNPSTLKKIGVGAFGWTGLSGFEIPDSVIYVGNSAFKYTPMLDVIIGSGVTFLRSETFALCPYLVDITFKNTPSIENGLLVINNIDYGYLHGTNEASIVNALNNEYNAQWFYRAD